MKYTTWMTLLLAGALLAGCPDDGVVSETVAPGEDTTAPEDTGASGEVDQPDAGEVPDEGPTSDAGQPDATEQIDTTTDVADTEAADVPEVDDTADVADVDAEPDTEDIEDVDDTGEPDTGDVEDVDDAGDLDQDVEDTADVSGDVDDPDVFEPAPEEAQVMEFLNHAMTTKSVLSSQVGLSGATPGAIIDYRAGDDLLPGTDDDVIITSLDELDAVSGVGQASIAKLVAFARNWTPVITDPLLVALNAGEISASQLMTEVGVSSSAAANIVAWRAGADDSIGTADDRFFATRAEVDDISGVGPATLEDLETWAGVGTTEILSTGTSANLISLSFSPLGEALVVGTPVGGTPHVLWYTPFSEETTVGEDPYVFLPLEGAPEAMSAVAFAPQGDVAAMVGEVGGIYFFAPFDQTFDFVPVPDVDGFTDVAFDPAGTTAYAVQLDGTVLSYTFGGTSPTVFEPNTALVALTTSDAFALAGVGSDGQVEVFAGKDDSVSLPLPTAEDLFMVLDTGDALYVGGADGATASQVADTWQRVPTRSLQSIRAAAVAPDASYLLLVGSGGLLLRYTPTTGEVAPITPPVGADLWSVAFDTDGNAVIVGAAGTAIRYSP